MTFKKGGLLHKFFPILMGAITFCVVASIGMLMCFWLFWPEHPETVKYIHVKNNQVAGSTLIYTIDLCKHTDLTPTLVRGISSVGEPHFAIPYPAVSGAIKQGCETTHVSMALPANTPPGKYVLRDVADFKVNPLRHIYVTTTSNVFTIVSAKA